jgi:hypothetical protein
VVLTTVVVNCGIRNIIGDYFLAYDDWFTDTGDSEENSDSFSLKMRAVYSSETSTNFNRTTGRPISEKD